MNYIPDARINMKEVVCILLLACSASSAHAERWLTLVTDWPMYEAAINPESLRIDGIYRYARLKVALLRPVFSAGNPELAKSPAVNMRYVEFPEFRVNCPGASYRDGANTVIHRLDGGKVSDTEDIGSSALDGRLGNGLVQRICTLDPKFALQPSVKIEPTATQQERIVADPATIWRQRGMTTMWYVQNFPQPRQLMVGKNANLVSNSMRFLGQFNCKEQEWRTLLTMPMTERNGEGDIIDTSNQQSEWKSVALTGAGSDILAVACDKP
jgi:hypothetical protein